MGGNALKNNVKNNRVCRLSKNDFNFVSKNVITLLKNKYNNIQCGVPRSILNKEDFGDLDLVVASDNYIDHDKLLDYLEKELNTPYFEYFKNNHLVSFSYPFEDKVFQVDLIFVGSKYFESSLNYLGDNDFSNFLGRILRKCGLKLTQKGLEFRFFYNNEEKKKESIILTQNWKEILDFLCLDYNQWKNGFETVEDMFKMITKCRYFKKELFPFENLNHIDRMRDRKRPNYNKFLEYIKNENIQDMYNLDFDDELKKEISRRLLVKFNKIDIYHKQLLKYEYENILKQFFNGNVVKELFNVENIELGNLIKLFKSKYNKLLEFALILNKSNMDFTKQKEKYNNFLIELKKELR